MLNNSVDHKTDKYWPRLGIKKTAGTARRIMMNSELGWIGAEEWRKGVSELSGGHVYKPERGCYWKYWGYC